MNEWEKFLEKQKKRERDWQIIKAIQCPGHWWVSKISAVLDIWHPNKPICISKPNTFCETCGVKWDEREK